MDSLQEYALLFVVAAPVAVIVVIQVYLFVCGERGTLLLPSLKGFPRVEIEAQPEEELADVAPAARIGGTAKFAANHGYKEAA